MIQGKFIGLAVLTITFVCMSLLIIYFNQANIPYSPGYFSYNFPNEKRPSNSKISQSGQNSSNIGLNSNGEITNDRIDVTNGTGGTGTVNGGTRTVNGGTVNGDVVNSSAGNGEVGVVNSLINGDVVTDLGVGTDVVANSSSWVQLSEDELGKIVERGPDSPGILDPYFSAELDRWQYVYEKIPDYNSIFLVANQPGAKYYGTFSTEDECASACQNDFKFCAAYAWNPEIGTNQCFGRDLRHASMMPHRGIRSGVRRRIATPTNNDYLIWPNYNSVFELNPILNSDVKYYGKQDKMDDCLAQCKNDQQFCKAFSWNSDKDCFGRTDKYPNMAVQNGYTSGVLTPLTQ